MLEARMAFQVRDVLPALAYGAILTFVWMAIAIGVWQRWCRAGRHLRWAAAVAAGLVLLQLPFVAVLAAGFDPARLLPAPLSEDPELIGQLGNVAWIAAAGASVATGFHFALLLVWLRDRDPGSLPGLAGGRWRPRLIWMAGGGALLGAALAPLLGVGGGFPVFVSSGPPATLAARTAAVPFALAFGVQHELLYRGVLQPWIRRRVDSGFGGTVLAVVAPAALGALGQPARALPVLLLGVLFGVLRAKLDLEHAAAAHGGSAAAIALTGLL